MSLLTICQNVADYVGTSKPTLIVGNTEETAVRLLACAQAAGKELQRRHNWLALITEHTFSTVASQEDYDLPSDYSRLLNQTLWDRSNYEELRGPLTPQQWQEYKSSVLATTSTIWSRYRIRNVSGTVKFSVFPTPTAVNSFVFEYISKNWCESSGGTDQEAWAADTDTGILDEYLLELGTRWRMLNRLGMVYAEEKSEYENEVGQAKARDGGAPILNISGRKRYQLIGPQNVRDTGFGT